MNAIVVVDENWGIGRDGGLLTHLPGDLKYYKEKTLGKVDAKLWSLFRAANHSPEEPTL